jgi:predicted acyltransferase
MDTTLAPSLATAEPEPQPLTQSTSAAVTPRLLALDVFRGLTIAGMLLVNNAGKGKPYAPLDHAEWHGWTPTDLVFPFFLFIVGVAIPFSMGRRSAEQTRGQLLGRIAIRALALFMLGALLNGFSYATVALTLGERPAGVPLFTLGALPDGFVFLKFIRAVAWGFIPLGILALLIPWKSRQMQWVVPVVVTVTFCLLMFAVVFANRNAWGHGLSFDGTNLGGGIFRPDLYRIPGILQRIAICYAAAATLALFEGPRILLATLVLLLGIYSALMLVRVQDHPFFNGSLSKDDNLARRIDVAVFDHPRAADGSEAAWKHTYGAYPDPEGLLSTIPAMGTAILGVFVGMRLRRERPAAERCAQLLATGVFVTLLGVGLNAWLMPINKSIWTPSFVIFCGGMAMLGLGAIFYVTDVRGRRHWALPLVIYGRNAIAAFVAAALVVRIGLIVKFPDPKEPGSTHSLIGVVKDWAADQVGHADAWLHLHINAHMPSIYTPANESLAYALLFVLTIFVLMSILYVCRIFVKV